jgi:hypothetical protein
LELNFQVQCDNSLNSPGDLVLVSLRAQSSVEKLPQTWQRWVQMRKSHRPDAARFSEDASSSIEKLPTRHGHPDGHQHLVISHRHVDLLKFEILSWHETTRSVQQQTHAAQALAASEALFETASAYTEQFYMPRRVSAGPMRMLWSGASPQDCPSNLSPIQWQCLQLNLAPMPPARGP